jgi:hypothetical protein
MHQYSTTLIEALHSVTLQALSFNFKLAQRATGQQVPDPININQSAPLRLYLESAYPNINDIVILHAGIHNSNDSSSARYRTGTSLMNSMKKSLAVSADS